MKAKKTYSIKVYADTFAELTKLKKGCGLPKQAIVRIAMAALYEALHDGGKRISTYGLR